MFDVNASRTLRALSHVKDLRKTLAEAEYLRRLRQQRDLQQDCDIHARQLARSKSMLPQQKAAVMAELRARPCDVWEIHSAHETVRRLHVRVETLEQECLELRKKHQEACADQESARHKFMTATRQLQKFQEIGKRNDTSMIQQCNEQEQAELEDRAYPRSHSI
jgi:hypothetical protein